jgi:hypothetical protein
VKLPSLKPALKHAVTPTEFEKGLSDPFPSIRLDQPRSAASGEHRPGQPQKQLF